MKLKKIIFPFFQKFIYLNKIKQTKKIFYIKGNNDIIKINRQNLKFIFIVQINKKIKIHFSLSFRLLFYSYIRSFVRTRSNLIF